MSDRMRGACLCGGVTFEVDGAEAMGVCHCTRCRRNKGSNSVFVVVTKEKYRITGGQELVKRYHEEGFSDRYFCGRCGSGLYAEGNKLYVSAGTLKATEMMPAFHIQVANKAPWDEIGGKAPQYPEWPTA
jgi:hypothetical protein